MMKRYLTAVLVLFSVLLFGKEPVGKIYWVQFNSKVNTPFSIENPEMFLSSRAIERRTVHNIAIDSTDLPVDPVYVDSLETLGFYVKHTSRWMNAAIAVLDTTVSIDSILKPSFIDFYQLRKDPLLKSASLKFFETNTLTHLEYGNSYTQVSMLNGQVMHLFSKGEGMQVAVIDAGFNASNTIPVFDSIFARNGILGTRDFVKPGNNVYKEHYHGNAVLSLMAGNDPGKLIGTAPAADYWLLRSEDVGSETPIEEDYWIVAAEFADSVGCDVINTSLGYSTFDEGYTNHAYDEFDGKTMRISQAANLAVDKGIVVVCSAGNSGSDSWGHIVTPSEAEKVLSIAAVNNEGFVTKFSSRGFTDNWALQKPDVAAMGSGVTFASTNGTYTTGNGTSFSSPIIAGMATCLRAYYPEKSASEIIDLIRSLGNHFPDHDIAYGYGIPDFGKLFPGVTTQVDYFEHKALAYPNPFTSELTIVNDGNFNSFELFGMNGTKVFGSNLNGNVNDFSGTILSTLKKGVYFAVLMGERQVQSFKLIKY